MSAELQTLTLDVDERPDGFWVTGLPGGAKSDCGPYLTRGKADDARAKLERLYASAPAPRASTKPKAAAEPAAVDCAARPRPSDLPGQRELF